MMNLPFAWASNYPDLFQLCKRFNLTENGPQCGIVALAMVLEDPTKEDVLRLFLEARAAGFTYNGEMFSAKDMYNLAKNNLSQQVTLYSGLLDSQEIIQFLFVGGVMLVPYDCDKNHAPCLQKGHKAHWALITGIIETNDDVYITARHGKTKNIGLWSLKELSDSNAQLEEPSPDLHKEHAMFKLPKLGLGNDNGLKCKAICISPEEDMWT